MWGPGLAKSEAVTFFAVLPVSWLPEDKTTRADYHTFPLLYRVIQLFSALTDTYTSNFSLMHFRKKDCEFFSRIFKKLQIFANFLLHY